MAISYNGTLSRVANITGPRPGIQFDTATTLPAKSFAIVAVRWEGGGASDAATFSLTSGGGGLTWSEPVYVNAGGTEDQRLGFVWAKAPSGGSITPGVTFSVERTLPHIMQLVFEYTGDDVSLADLATGNRSENGTGWSVAAIDGLIGDQIVAIVSNYNGATPISAPSGYDAGVASTLLFSFYETAASDGEITISGSTSDSYAAHGMVFREVTAAPVLSSPSVTDLQPGTATALITTTVGSGTIYAYYSTNAIESAATIKSSGVSQAVSAVGQQSIPLTGLPLGEAGYVHFIQTADGQDSNIVSYGFTTAVKMTQSTTATVALPAGYNMVELSGELYTRGLTQLQRTPQPGWQMIGQTSEIEWAEDGSAQVKKIDAPFNVWIADELGKLSRIVYDATGLDSAVFPETPTLADATNQEPGAEVTRSFTLSVPDNQEEPINVQAVGVGATITINDGEPVSSGVAYHGDTITVTGYASLEFGATEVYGVEMSGGVAAYFTIATRAAVTPTITAQPSNDTVEAGSPGSFSVTMTDAVSYQWYLVGTGAVSGATSNTFAPTTASGDAGTTRQYYVIGTSPEGGTVQSNTVTLTITNAAASFTSAEPLRDNETKALLANTLVSYKLITADGTEVEGSATTDASGYLSDSSVEFGAVGDTVIVYGEFGTYITGFKVVLE